MSRKRKVSFIPRSTDAAPLRQNYRTTRSSATTSQPCTTLYWSKISFASSSLTPALRSATWRSEYGSRCSKWSRS